MEGVVSQVAAVSSAGVRVSERWVDKQHSGVCSGDWDCGARRCK